MTDEERSRELTRSSFAAQMAMLGYEPNGNPKDMVEVVRCKDCKHGSLYCTEDVCGETLIECNRPDLGDVIEIHSWKWFCADGVEKYINVHGKGGW